MQRNDVIGRSLGGLIELDDHTHRALIDRLQNAIMADSGAGQTAALAEVALELHHIGAQLGVLNAILMAVCGVDGGSAVNVSRVS